jgi:serine/threonine protein kinase
MSLEESSPAVDSFELNGFEFGLGKLGCTQLVEARKGDELFCGKLIPNAKLPEFLQSEGRVHKVLRAHPHPNILAPVCVASGKDVSGVILPSIAEDLHTLARNRKGIREAEAKGIFHSIVSAVHHCHKHRIVIRDLRLGKFFYKQETGEVVLADLDSAQLVSPTSPFLSDRKGSPAFVSPEVVVSQSYDGAAADMWALGVVLYILLTGTYPFRDSHPANLFQKIQQGHAAVVFPPSMSEAARDIIRRLLVKEPHLRMTAEELSRDLWFAVPKFVSTFNKPASRLPAPRMPVATVSTTRMVCHDTHKRPYAPDEVVAAKRMRETQHFELQLAQ